MSEKKKDNNRHEVALITDQLFTEHLTPDGHPERPERMRALEETLGQAPLSSLKRIPITKGTTEQLLLAHQTEYVELICSTKPPVGCLVQLDMDTFMSSSSLEVALYVVGSSCRAVDETILNDTRVFCATRPPGHHATRDKAMGFCLFNNAAIAARWAQKQHKIERVAIVDFDVHHGNGTQDIFWDDATVMYASSHQIPLYPGTGEKDEVGTANTIVNAPLKPGAGGKEFRAAMDGVILPRIDQFKPELLIISAGFDAHRLDTIGNLELTEADFAWVTRELVRIANAHSEGRVVSILEGGYNLRGLSMSVASHIEALMT